MADAAKQANTSTSGSRPYLTTGALDENPHNFKTQGPRRPRALGPCQENNRSRMGGQFEGPTGTVDRPGCQFPGGVSTKNG